jgi:putative transposase
MPRKLRIEYENALYHVINRGNDRDGVFETAGAPEVVLKALEEASATYGWIVHAYVIMKSHYHLAIETPKPNLVDGMHWLQSTIAGNVKRLGKSRGPVFQGRYKAILLEDVTVLTRVVNYIHLNPVRARVVKAEKVGNFEWSSLKRFVNGPRFKNLGAKTWLRTLGFSDTKAGWKSYLERLIELAGDKAQQEQQGFAKLSKGWAIGTPGWRKALADVHARRALAHGVEAARERALKERRWFRALKQLMSSAKKKNADAIATPKGAKWKVSIAKKLRQLEGASISWIAVNLKMGAPGAVRSYLRRSGTGKGAGPR